MIIDSHCHLHDEKFDNDLTEVMSRAKKANISHFITIGCDLYTTQKAESLAANINNVFFSAGFHPHEAKDLNDMSLQELKRLAKNKKCVAIGEIGLDYYYLNSDHKTQVAAFERQLQLAQELNLPVVIHLRDAFFDCVEILRRFPDLLLGRILIHCFSGTVKEAQILTDLGCFLSISGIITFKNAQELNAVAQTIPLSRLMVETDCPYLSPVPFRGKRNEPSYIVYTLAKIAEARNEDVAKVEEQMWNNTIKFFNLAVT